MAPSQMHQCHRHQHYPIPPQELASAFCAANNQDVQFQFYPGRKNFHDFLSQYENMELPDHGTLFHCVSVHLSWAQTSQRRVWMLIYYFHFAGRRLAVINCAFQQLLSQELPTPACLFWIHCPLRLRSLLAFGVGFRPCPLHAATPTVSQNLLVKSTAEVKSLDSLQLCT